MAQTGARDENVAQAKVERVLGLRKSTTSLYFYYVLEALFEGQPLPAVPEMAEAEVEQRIRQTNRDIVALYEEFGERLRLGDVAQ